MLCGGLSDLPVAIFEPFLVPFASHLSLCVRRGRNLSFGNPSGNLYGNSRGKSLEKILRGFLWKIGSVLASIGDIVSRY